MAPDVVEVCSVSNCAFHFPQEWIGFFDSPADALAVVPPGAPGFRLFAYRCLMTRYRGGVGEPWGLPWDPHPVPLDEGYRSLGFDVVSRFIEDILGFGCSGPLCDPDVAAEVGANRHCLIGTLEQAVALAQRLSRENPDEGTFYVVDVLEKEAEG